jgi:hypothetical protein
MSSEQTDEYFFSKMTSFSLLKFKFSQNFLMGQNGFSKMTELWVNAAELSVNSAELSTNAANFDFSKIYLSHVKHDSTKF